MIPIISREMVIEAIENVILKIRKNKKFDAWNKDWIPEIDDYLKILEINPAKDILKMVGEDKFLAPMEIIEKYKDKIKS